MPSLIVNTFASWTSSGMPLSLPRPVARNATRILSSARVESLRLDPKVVERRAEVFEPSADRVLSLVNRAAGQLRRVVNDDVGRCRDSSSPSMSPRLKDSNPRRRLSMSRSSTAASIRALELLV